MAGDGNGKNVVIARAGLVLVFFVFFIAARSAAAAEATPLVVLLFGIPAALCLGAAIFASEKVAMFLGRWLP